MKVFLIDPFTRTITEVDHDDSLESIYRLTQCECFTTFRLNEKHYLLLDDEGLLKDLEQQAFFQVHGVPLAGRALCTGIDFEGNTISPSITLEELTAQIHWIEAHQLRRL